MTIVYHIAPAADWEAARAAGTYTAASLRSEGFIHCSTAEQVIATANRLFKGRTGLLLLCIDTARIDAEIRYENLEGGSNLFPHVYGALEAGSIIAVHDLLSASDGSFELPQSLRPRAGA